MGELEAFVGVNGSATERARFGRHMRRAGFGDSALTKPICSIGISGIGAKEPAAVAAQLPPAVEAHAATNAKNFPLAERPRLTESCQR